MVEPNGPVGVAGVSSSLANSLGDVLEIVSPIDAPENLLTAFLAGVEVANRIQDPEAQRQSILEALVAYEEQNIPGAHKARQYLEARWTRRAAA